MAIVEAVRSDVEERGADDTFEGYRLIRERSLHPFVMIRIGTGPGAAPVALTTVFGGDSSERRLTDEQWDQLRRLVEKLDFWEMPHEVVEVQGKSHVWGCLDGSSWQIEGAARGRYHRVLRRCIGATDPIRTLGERFIGLSGRALEPIY